MPIYQVEMNIGNEWENVWQEGQEGGGFIPQTFQTEATAQAAIDELLSDVSAAVAAAHMGSEYSADEFRIVPIRAPISEPSVFGPSDLLTAYDAVEIHGVGRHYDENGSSWCEQCDDDKADFFSVYLHLKEGGVECVGDFPTEEAARIYADSLSFCIQVYRLESSSAYMLGRDHAYVSKYYDPPLGETDRKVYALGYKAGHDEIVAERLKGKPKRFP